MKKKPYSILAIIVSLPKIFDMGTELLPQYIIDNYEVHEWKHACAILKNDFPDEWQDITELLTNFKLCKSWITEGGGRKSKVSTDIDSFFYERGWLEKEFATSVKVDLEDCFTPEVVFNC